MSETSSTEPGATPTRPVGPGLAKTIPKGTETSRLYTLAVLLSSVVVALPITVGRAVEAILDITNPAGLKDVTVGLAYLREILGWSFGVLGVLIVVIVAVFALIYRRERTLDALRLPLLIFAVQVVLGVLALLFAGIIPSANE